MAPASFYFCRFFSIPILLKNRRLGDCVFDFVNFEGYETSDAQQLLSLRNLRSEVSRSDNHHFAIKLASYEHKVRHLLELKQAKFLSSLWFEKLFSATYDFYSEYGRNLARPVYIWIFLIFYFSFCYYQLANVEVAGVIAINESRYWPSLAYSFNLMMGPFGMLSNFPFVNIDGVAISFASVFQRILSSAMIFVWMLQVRSRFKL